MGDMWNAPNDDGHAQGSLGGLSGGDPAALEDPMAAANAVIADVKEHLVPYLLCGLSFSALFTGIILACVAVPFLGMLPGMIAEDELLLSIGSIVGFSAYTILLLGAVFVAYPLMAASTLRALDRQLRGQGTIGLMSPVDGLLSGAGRVLAFYALGMLLTMVGALMCYVPGLIAAMLVMFAMPMVVIDGVGPVEAYQRGWAHMREHPTWHLPVWLLMFIGSTALQLTFVGIFFIYPLMLAYHLAAHRIAFGDSAPDGGVVV